MSLSKGNIRIETKRYFHMANQTAYANQMSSPNKSIDMSDQQELSCSILDQALEVEETVSFPTRSLWHASADHDYDNYLHLSLNLDPAPQGIPSMRSEASIMEQTKESVMALTSNSIYGLTNCDDLLICFLTPFSNFFINRITNNLEWVVVFLPQVPVILIK